MVPSETKCKLSRHAFTSHLQNNVEIAAIFCFIYLSKDNGDYIAYLHLDSIGKDIYQVNGCISLDKWYCNRFFRVSSFTISLSM